MSRLICSAVAALMLNTLVALPCSAHPFHISTAEMEFNSKTGKFEVALKLHANDLERALSLQAGRRINLDLWTEDSSSEDRGSEGKDSEDKDARELRLKQLTTATEAYLTKHFFLTKPGSAQSDSDQQSEKKSSEPDAKTNASQPLTRAKLVGHEFESSWLWLYFELEAASVEGEAVKSLEKLAESPSLLLLQNSIFLDMIDKQINTVSIRFAPKRATLKMTVKEPRHPFEAAWFQSQSETN